MLHSCKRRITHQTVSNEVPTSTPVASLLDLPVPLICDILSRLTIMDIFRSRCVCSVFLKLLMDPYFSKIHLSRGPALRTNIVLQESNGRWGVLRFFPFDHTESTLSSCSSDIHCPVDPGLPKLSKRSSEFCFRTRGLTLVGSCDGLLCLCSNPPMTPFYVICNPILGECIRLPRLITAPSPLYTRHNHSGYFGYCPRLNQYKVISFLHVNVHKQFVAYIHTLGSDSWRRSESAPCPKLKSFDPFLNGALHWITDAERPSELISSFDLESEKFTFVPPPAQFNLGYLNKVSWVNVGVLRGCLCICYIYEDVWFDVWVMREYGVRESWTKEFGIDLKFYCKLRVEDLYRPIKFFGNGDMWFVSASDALVSFSPQKRTFKELRAIGPCKKFEASAHALSFVSLKDVVGENNPEVLNLGIRSRDFMFDL